MNTFIRKILFLSIVAISGISMSCGSPTEDTVAVTNDPSGNVGGTTQGDTGGTAGDVIIEELKSSFTGSIVITESVSPLLKSGGEASTVRSSATPQGYIVAAVNSSTNQVYHGTTASDGSFSVNVPESSANYTLQMLDSNGRYMGPMTTSSASSGQASTGFTSAGGSMGNISIPTDRSSGPITSDASLTVDSSEYARLNTSGAPVGQVRGGKGSGARMTGSASSGTQDIDRDGVPNAFDADNNGSGTPDDLDSTETSRGSEGFATSSGVQSIATIVNLKITNHVDQQTMYSGTSAQKDVKIGDALAIGFKIMAGSGKTISSAVCSAGASWRTTTQITASHTAPGTRVLWSDASNASGVAYGLDCSLGSECNAGVYPGAPISTGDTLFFNVTYSDGTSETAIWSVSFGFKDIPKLVAYTDGTPATNTDYTDFDISGATENGSSQDPIIHTAGNDLWLKFSPPIDENGDFLWEDSINHFKFELFPHDSTGSQVNQVDSSSWNSGGSVTIAHGPDPVEAISVSGANYQNDVNLSSTGSTVDNWVNGAFAWESRNSDLSFFLDNYTESKTSDDISTDIADNYYTIVLPADIFDESLTSGGQSKTITCWDFDIAAQKGDSNAAIKLYVATAENGCNNN